MKNRKSILLVVLLLAVGFAAVSTTLYINGSTNINPNQDDFDVYYSDAYVNGTQDKSVITDDTHIVFETELSTLGEKYVLDYEVTNGSKNYDAELIMECTGDNEYLTVTNEFDDETILEARSIRNGTLTLELTKSNASEDLDVTIECTISANALERDTLNEDEIQTASQYMIEGYYKDENNDILANKNLVIFSDIPHYVTTDENGYLFYNGLERGSHEIYYVDDELNNIKKMSKQDIINIATASSNFKTTQTENVVFDNGYVIENLNIESDEDYCNNAIGESWEYNYINGEQKFIVRCNGSYKLETYGAQGGSAGTYIGGKGGYSTGTLKLTQNEYLYINIGGQGQSLNKCITTNEQYGAYNGGTYVSCQNNIYFGSGGGGATHIATTSGVLSTLSNNKESILIVAGGGGGSSSSTDDNPTTYGHGGSGGGETGGIGTNDNKSRTPGTGGTQLTPGISSMDFSGATPLISAAFGQGCSAKYSYDSYMLVSGGGGYYGGGCGTHSGGGGGSGYVGSLINSETKNGIHEGNGYAKITYLGTN